MIDYFTVRHRHRQSGIVLLLMLFLVLITGIGWLVTRLRASAAQVELARQIKGADALAIAKDALIGFSAANPDRGHLPCPADPVLAGTATEGTALGTCRSKYSCRPVGQ